MSLMLGLKNFDNLICVYFFSPPENITFETNQKAALWKGIHAFLT